MQILSFIPIIYVRATTLFFILFFLFHIIIDITFGSHFDRHFIVVFVFLIPWGDVLPGLPGNFKGRFWSFVSLPVLWGRGLKKKAIIVCLFSVSLFVFTMSVYAPYSLRHLYPFSTTTMYAWIDKPDQPIKRKVIFVVDRDDRKRLVKRAEIWPIAYSKIFSKFREWERTGTKEEALEKIKTVLRKIQKAQPVFNYKGVHSFEFIKTMTLEHCYWNTAKGYILHPNQPDHCRVVVEESF